MQANDMKGNQRKEIQRKFMDILGDESQKSEGKELD